jgi:hypothetical protein
MTGPSSSINNNTIIELEISPDLQSKGFRLIKDGSTIVLEDSQGNQARSYIYQEWNKTTKKFEDEIEKTQMVKDRLIQQEILTCLSRNYPRIMNGHNSSNHNSSAAVDSTEPIELTEELTKEVSWKETSSTLSTSIKRDDDPKLITFNGMLLAQTNDDQFNTGFQAESSVGKSYVPLEVATYFPESEIVKIASASPTAFYHSGVWDPERSCAFISEKVFLCPKYLER